VRQQLPGEQHGATIRLKDPVWPPTTYGYLARHNLLKGWLYLSQIIPSATKLNPNLRFRLAGDGVLSATIRERLHREIESGCVEIVGGLRSDAAKQEFFQSIDAFVCPAHAPTTVIEALNSFRPVVLMRRWRDCADGIDTAPFVRAGWILERKDLGVNEAAELLANPPELRCERMWLEDHLSNDYSWPRVAERALSEYQSILARERR